MKQQDVSSTRNALRLAEQAEATGRDTLARLGAQGERIHNTERNLDMSSSQNRIAEEKARELKTLNKSMFAMHVSNPFTSGARREERDRKVMETHRLEREQRDATRKAAWETSARGSEAAKGIGGRPGGTGAGKSTLADRAKFQFEADSEDDEMENEIDNNLDQLRKFSLLECIVLNVVMGANVQCFRWCRVETRCAVESHGSGDRISEHSY